MEKLILFSWIKLPSWQITPLGCCSSRSQLILVSHVPTTYLFLLKAYNLKINQFFIIIISLLMSPLLGHRPSYGLFTKRTDYKPPRELSADYANDGKYANTINFYTYLSRDV
jgi:hypothetical protein